MARKQFRYYLKADNTTYYYVANGVVFTTTTPTPIQSDPVEWRETDLKWVRSSKYHGIFRQFVLPITFYADAATILRHIFYSQAGIESVCILQIDRKKVKNGSTPSDETYESWYTGDIDFSQKHDDNLHFQVAVLDRGLAALIKAYESTPYEIPIEDADCLNIYMDGIRLKNKSALVLANDPLVSASSHQMMPTITIQGNESQVQVDVIAQPVQQVLGSNTLTSSHPFFKATVGGTVSIEYDITIQVSNPASSSLATHTFVMLIRKFNTVTSIATDYFIYQNPNFTSYVGTNHAAGTVNIPIAAGEHLVYFAGLFAFNGGAGTDAFIVTQAYSYSTLKVSYDLKLPATFVRAYRLLQVWQKLIDLLSGGQYTGISTFLNNPNLITVDNKPYNTLVTSGNALRGLGHPAVIINVWGGTSFTVPAEWAKIKTTLDEFHADNMGSYMTGIGVEGSAARLEHQSFFYDASTLILNVGEVTKLQIDVALEYIQNLLKVGIPDQDYDNLNGKDEPNTTQVYSLPIIRKKEELDLTCPYRDDMYGIEYQRSELLGKDTTDAKADSDTFVIEVADFPTSTTLTILNTQVTKTAYPLARRQNNTGNSATGLIAADTAFNLSRTPKRKFYRNAPRIALSVHQQQGKTITFQTTDKNPNVASNLGSGNIIENADVPVSSLAAPLFLPIHFTFETEVPKNLADLISLNPYGRIDFSFRDKKGDLHTASGFIDEVNIKPGDNAACTWKLLATPNTNLTDLIYR